MIATAAMRGPDSIFRGLICLLCITLGACSKDAPVDYSGPVGGWDVVTGEPGGGQYSPLNQINRENVSRLQVAWTYESSDLPRSSGSALPANGKSAAIHDSFSVEVTPIVVEDKLVFCTPTHRVVALDAESGSPLWNYDPKMDLAASPSYFCRGVASWSDSQTPSDSYCGRRVISTSGDGRLFALDAHSGKLCEGFGDQGMINLKAHMGPLKPRELYYTSPPLVVKDLIVIGGSVRDGYRVGAAGGVVRAYDARSGKLVWAWDPVGPGMTPVSATDAMNGKTFTRGTPNVWSLMSADIEHGLIFLPTGNAAVDYYKGAERPIDYYGSSVVALKIDTGEVVWRFQTVRHDLWDYDVAAQPVLYEHEGKIPAISIATKQGFVFLLNRLTGQPIFKIEERPVPASDVPGEWVSSTQPFPTRPRPLIAPLTEQDIIGYPIGSRGCREAFDGSRHDGMYTPPSLKGTLQSPGDSGGFNWGSNSVDGDRRLFIGVLMNMPGITKLVPRSVYESGEDKEVPIQWGRSPQYGTPHSVRGPPFLSTTGVPCIKPPWGELVAIDLDSGALRWRRPLGSLYGRVPLIGRWLNVGVPVSGGVLQTGGGLVFAGATIDEHLRAFNISTGDVVWTTHLPFSTHGIPITYRLRKDSRQYLVVATGGGVGIDLRVGNTLVAFALPE